MTDASKKNLDKQRTPRGDNVRSILSSLAQEFPYRHSREDFLAKLYPSRLKGAARTLGALMAQRSRKGSKKKQQVGESLHLVNGPAVGLDFAGLVSATVNLVELTNDWRLWREQKDAQGESRPEPNQELIVLKIIEETGRWIETEIKNNPQNTKLNNRCPIVLLDVSIIHGSSEIDLLLTILYRSNEDFMRYVREVIQRANHIQGTHTMQIGMRIGYPSIGPASLSPSG